MNNKFSLLIVEDDKLYAENITQVINEDPELIVQKVFENTDDAIEFIGKNRSIDMIILDIGLPGKDGISSIKSFKEIDDKLKIVMLTIFDDDEKIFNSAKEGANGYLLKGDSDEKIIRSIHEVLEGGGALNAGVAARMLKYFIKCNKSNESCLTENELQILKQFCEGRTKKEIAIIVNRSVHTVDSHIRNIYQKLHVSSRAEAVSKALKKGIL